MANKMGEVESIDREYSFRVKKNHLLTVLGLVALVALTAFLTHLAGSSRGAPTVSGAATVDAPYQVALPYQAPEMGLMPGQILVPAQVLSPGEIVVPNRGVVYVSSNQLGKVYTQTYTDLKVARISGYAQPMYRNGGNAPAQRTSGGWGSTLSRGEKGAIIGGLIGAGTGALIDKKERGRGAGVGGLIGALTGGIIGHSTR
jgi:hypothetical protein